MCMTIYVASTIRTDERTQMPAPTAFVVNTKETVFHS